MAKELKQVFVKPAPGCMVRDELTRRFLKEEGEWKPESIYWLRRIRMVDVIKCDPPPQTEPKKSKRPSSRDDSSPASGRTDRPKKDEDSR